ncbi:hypothetical protein [Pseudomonas borbori]|uniref:hypothetical protein n=1 Tax=Pseudomonas borbori TaxID=289003 RepID=UPI00147994F0|nr:hypothetical protein [Pseudomonas borbori]
MLADLQLAEAGVAPRLLDARQRRIEVMQIGCHTDMARVHDAALASGVAVQGAFHCWLL